MKTFPAHGLWVRHARNVSIKDVSFSVDKADARPAVLLDDVQGATVDGLRSSLASSTAVRAVRSREVRVRDVERLA
jgi:hypothetical protein